MHFNACPPPVGVVYRRCYSYVSTIMVQWKLFLLLLLCWCLNSEVTLVKTIGKGPDVTPVCTNETLNIITLIVCKIRTERNRGEECRLLYQYGRDFLHECDSRFTLMSENQTVFLHLTSLTPVDSGSYTCECSRPAGTYTIHLNITVEGDGDTSRSIQRPIPGAVIGTIIVIIITVFVGFIYRTKRNGDCSRSAASGSSVCETPGSLDQDDPYTRLELPASDIYQTISSSASNMVAVQLDKQEIGGRETDPTCTVYEDYTKRV